VGIGGSTDNQRLVVMRKKERKMDIASDLDPLETAEWRAALDSVLAFEGPERTGRSCASRNEHLPVEQRRRRQTAARRREIRTRRNGAGLRIVDICRRDGFVRSKPPTMKTRPSASAAAACSVRAALKCPST
jgi:hypothetical protein